MGIRTGSQIAAPLGLEDMKLITFFQKSKLSFSLSHSSSLSSSSSIDIAALSLSHPPPPPTPVHQFFPSVPAEPSFTH